MKKILLVGNSPLPNEMVKIRPAAGLRTFQFLKGIKENVSNIDMRLLAIAMPNCYQGEIFDREYEVIEGVGCYAVPKNDSRLVSKFQKFHDEFKPDIIVSINSYPSFVASKLKSSAVLWCDLNGWIMAEGQAQAYKMDSDDYLGHYFEIEQNVLRKADKLSSVSDRQKFALLGELASMGRLNKETFGYEFVEVVPNGVEVEDFDSNLSHDEANEGFARVQSLSGGGAFLILWMGGYNTWVDEETLFKGVVEAMEACKELYFVSTGGSLEGLDSATFAKFKEMVEGSELKDRFIFLGWVDSELIPSIYKRSNLGLNVDRMCVETLTGARNRINEMLKFGLPVVTTLGSEISHDVVGFGAGVGVKSGDWDGLAKAVIEMYEDFTSGGVKLKKYNEKALEYVSGNCSYKRTMGPLIEWLKDPTVAPDRGMRVKFGNSTKLKGFWKYLKENGFKKSFEKVVQRVKGL